MKPDPSSGELPAGRGDELRFTDILTTAAAVANYLGVPDVTAAHMLDAIAIQLGEKSMESLGRGVSPLMPKFASTQGGAEPGVRALAQRWWALLGSDVTATLSGEQLELLRSDLATLEGQPRSE